MSPIHVRPCELAGSCVCSIFFWHRVLKDNARIPGLHQKLINQIPRSGNIFKSVKITCIQRFTKVCKFQKRLLHYHDVQWFCDGAGSIKRVPVAKPVVSHHSSCDIIVPRPLNKPVSIQIVLAIIILQRQVVIHPCHLLHPDVPCISWYHGCFYVTLKKNLGFFITKNQRNNLLTFVDMQINMMSDICLSSFF